MTPFVPGSVGHTLQRMVGVWHDHVEIFDLRGRPLGQDPHGGVPGPAPYDNLVYVEFDGSVYRQTNVTFRGRPMHARSFSGKLVEGVLVFDRLGPGDPEHIGVAAGVDTLFFATRTLGTSQLPYSEPDCVQLFGTGERRRTTILYRHGEAVRTLSARGVRLAPLVHGRLPWDPRGASGPVHEGHRDTHVFQVSSEKQSDPSPLSPQGFEERP